MMMLEMGSEEFMFAQMLFSLWKGVHFTLC